MHEVLVNRLGGLSLPRKSVVRLTDRPDMTLDVYRGRKTTIQQQQQQLFVLSFFPLDVLDEILDEILDVIESVSEGFLTYFSIIDFSQPCMFPILNR